MWYVNSGFPPVYERLGLSSDGLNGWWSTSLCQELTKSDDVQLGIVWVSTQVTDYEEFESGGVTYYCLPVSNWAEEISCCLRGLPLIRKAWRGISCLRETTYVNELRACKKIVDLFDPDIIHVHGTESFYGLLASQVSRPVLISLQGILTECCQMYWGDLAFRQRFIPESMLAWIRMRSCARREQEIFLRNSFFVGRTNWDQSQQARLSPNARYYSCHEIMRPIFYQTEWSLKVVKKQSIYTTTASHPYKGTSCLIDAVALLCQRVPDVELRIGGQISHKGYGGYLREKVRELRLENNVNFLGYLRADQIADELRHAHTYVIPSYIENSPNGLAEAQLMGVPCIASYAGGIPSLVSEEETGLLFPKGDAALLASCLQRIFDNNDLATDLSHNARAVALRRHDRKNVVENLLSIYKDVIHRHRKCGKGSDRLCKVIVS